MKMSRDCSCSTLWYFSSNGDTPRPTPISSAAVAQVIEHADLVDHAQRRDQRQQIDQRPHLDALGRARHRAEEHARDRHHVERRLMVLGQMQAVEARLVRRLDELQPLVEQLRERPVAVLDVVEQSNFHFLVQSSDLSDHGDETLGVGLDELREFRLVHVGRRARRP